MLNLHEYENPDGYIEDLLKECQTLREECKLHSQKREKIVELLLEKEKEYEIFSQSDYVRIYIFNRWKQEPIKILKEVLTILDNKY